MVQFAREVSVTRHTPRADLYAPELFRALRLGETAPEYASEESEPSAHPALDPCADADALEELSGTVSAIRKLLRRARKRLQVYEEALEAIDPDDLTPGGG